MMMFILKTAKMHGIQKVLMQGPRDAFSLSAAKRPDQAFEVFVRLERKEEVSTLRVELSPFDIIIKRSETNSPFTSFCGA
ncbi:hypothetical protein GF391_00160 [Candidatus Uhrbacteria bacterium]|nr:hypothetical protein [Candidatus Uhrbacteria bacterium]